MATILPNAPLAEVVFELRWSIPKIEYAPPTLAPDPSYPAIFDGFEKYAKSVGFGTIRDIHPVYTGPIHGVARRFYQTDDSGFPLLQLGPGIMAVNDSSQYEGQSFKDRCIQATLAIKSYFPKLKSGKYDIVRMELKYIDVFNKEVVGTINSIDFCRAATNLQIDLIDFLKSDVFRKQGSNIRFQYDSEVSSKFRSRFSFDIGSGKNEVDDVVRLESRVVSAVKERMPRMNSKKFGDDIDAWLEEAHSVTSPFFRDFIKSDVLQKFK
ncbi:MAG: TIGR04255 family protein [Rhodospirillales bacterium]